MGGAREKPIDVALRLAMQELRAKYPGLLSDKMFGRVCTSSGPLTYGKPRNPVWSVKVLIAPREPKSVPNAPCHEQDPLGILVEFEIDSDARKVIAARWNSTESVGLEPSELEA